MESLDNRWNEHFFLQMPVPNTQALEKNSTLFNNGKGRMFSNLLSDLIKFSVTYIPLLQRSFIVCHRLC